MEKKLRKLNEKFATDMVYLKQSKIRNAGIGVFAKQPIRRYARLGEYIGKVVNINDQIPESKRNYLFEIQVRGGPNFYKDARKLDDANWTRYINGVRLESQRKKENVGFYQYKKRIWVKALKNIPRDEELIADYGEWYGW